MNIELNNNQETIEHLIRHCEQYPSLNAEDMFKYIYQSAFGCEHLVTDEKNVLEYIKREYKDVSKTDCPLIEPLDGQYSRVHLSCLNGGLKAETLAKLFLLSAKTEPDGMALLTQKIQVLKELVERGALPLDKECFNSKLDEWISRKCPAIHHSDDFRQVYRPAYRVIANKYAAFLNVFSAIDRLSAKDSVIIAIEGGSASGKSTLSEMLEEVYGCTVLHMDDFFLRPEQRTSERLSEIGGNVDRERFLEEVLKPLSEQRDFIYRKFDCSTQMLCPPINIVPQKMTVVEGVYSMHPLLSPYYDFSVFLDIDRECQRERILKRNSPPFAERFFNEWIPLERKYFSQMNVKEKCSLCVRITKQNGIC